MLHEAETEAFGDGSGVERQACLAPRVEAARGARAVFAAAGLAAARVKALRRKDRARGEVGQIGSDVSRQARAPGTLAREIIFQTERATPGWAEAERARRGVRARATFAECSSRERRARRRTRARRGEGRARRPRSPRRLARNLHRHPIDQEPRWRRVFFRSGANAIGARAHLDTVIEAAIASSELRVRVTSEPYGVSSALLASRAIVDGAPTRTTV
jgi:hypothetical protein